MPTVKHVETGELLAIGNHSYVYEIGHRARHVVKVERSDTPGILQREIEVYRAVAGNHRFCVARQCANCDRTSIVLERMDAACNCKVRGKWRPIRIVCKLINQLKDLHDAGFVHADIRLENIVFRSRIGTGKEADRSLPVLIDFSSAVRIGSHSGQELIGKQWLLASTRALKGRRLYRRDDIESLYYFLLAYVNGNGKRPRLPWSECRDMEHVIAARKEYADEVPTALQAFKTFLDELGDEDVPDYDALKRLLCREMCNLRSKNDRAKHC